jgi:hypothetical protein
MELVNEQQQTAQYVCGAMYTKDPRLLTTFDEDEQALAIYWNHVDNEPQMLDDELQLRQGIALLSHQGAKFKAVVPCGGYNLIVLQCDESDEQGCRRQPPFDPMAFQLSYSTRGFVFVCKRQCLTCRCAYRGIGPVLDLHCLDCSASALEFDRLTRK